MMHRLGKSFKAAWNGLKDVLVFESTFRIMVVIAIFVIAAMLYFPTSRTEKAILLVMIFAVLILELLNSVIERIMDFVYIGHHEHVKEIKDLMASIVLVISFAALAIGTLVFWPHVAELIKNYQ